MEYREKVCVTYFTICYNLQFVSYNLDFTYNYAFRDKLWRWIDSDLRKNEINSSYFERKWFSKNENDTRVEIIRGIITDIWINLLGIRDSGRPKPFRYTRRSQ